MSLQPQQHHFHAPNLEGPEDTHRVAWLEWGDPNNPRTIVCVHGLTRNAHDFDFLAAALAADYRVIAPDMPGRGDSDYMSNTANYSYGAYMADALALLDSLELETVDWIGTSMGGILGMMIAALHPERISRLVLNDIGAFIPKAGLERIVEYVGATPESFPTREAAEARLREIFTAFGVRHEAHWQHLFRYSIKQDNGTFHLSFDPNILAPFQEAEIDDVDLHELWDAVAVPTLILRGANSDILTHETAQLMVQNRTDVTLHAFAGIGHAPTLMEDEQIRVVREWLNRPTA